MKISILMPQVGQDIAKAVLISWRVKEGDYVKKGDIVAEVESDKAVFEVESAEQGKVVKLLYNEGDEATVLEPIAFLEDGIAAAEGDNLSDSVLASANTTTDNDFTVKGSDPGRNGYEPDSSPVKNEIVPGENTSQVFYPISPSAKRIVSQAGVGLGGIRGTGPGGRIIKRDIIKALIEEQSAQTVRGQYKKDEAKDSSVSVVKMSSAAKVMASRMIESKNNIPHFYLTTSVDVSNLLTFRKTGNFKPSLTDLIIKASALALLKFPKMGQLYTESGVISPTGINVGFALSADDGSLMVPVIRDADKLNLGEIAAKTKELSNRGRVRKLSPDEMSGGLFTVSCLFMYDVEQFTAIINPGETAILAIGRIAETPVAHKGEIVIRPIMKMTLSSDHRIADGVLAASFNGYVKTLLENPEKLG